VKYLDIKVLYIKRMSIRKSESLTGGSGVHVFLVLWKAARAVESFAENSVSQLEMCGSDFAVLEALLHKGPLPINEIGKKVLLTSGSITVAVDRLETKGLVERRAHGTDRRARIVHLTKEGRKLITRAYADHAADMERLASASLTRAGREMLICLLKQIGYKAVAESNKRKDQPAEVTPKGAKERK
jgi:MarR family 2-MHQ and catechol resistance regulon transcriptional repressor